MPCVVDASVLLALLLPDEMEPDEAVVEMLVGGRVVVPPHCATEVSNGLLVAHRRGRITFGEMTAALADAAALRIVTDTRERFGLPAGTVDLALTHRLTIYDAAYLELARRSEFPLATFDGRLREAAARENIVIFEQGS
jgi:predicted nucleic acid-binding protein